MNDKKTFWIKEEDTNELFSLPGSMIQVHPSTIIVKEEFQEDVSEEFLEDSIGISWPTDFIKEDPELNLEADGTVDNVVEVLTSFTSSSTRLYQSNDENRGILLEDTAHQRGVSDERKIDAEKSINFTVTATDTQGLTPQENSSIGAGNNCSLRQKEFHEFSCSKCLQTFSSKYCLTMHVFIHISGVQPPKYICKSCGEVFPSRFSLNKHFINLALYDARYKKQTTFIVGDHQDISNMQHTKKQLSWQEIYKSSKKSFGDTYNMSHAGDKLGADYVNVDPGLLPSEKLHICSVCNKSFVWSSDLKRHEAVHSGKRPYKCNLCGKAFILPCDLKCHSELHTGKRPHVCEICGKTFTWVKQLTSHKVIHSLEKPHTCHVCGKSFARASDCKRHRVLHTGSRSHKCNVCGKAFARGYGLQRHTVVHSDERPHKCHVCGKSFSREIALKDHITLHTGNRRYKSNICGKSFTQAGNLKSHTVLHSGQKPYKCEVCGKCFALLVSLKRHATRH